MIDVSETAWQWITIIHVCATWFLVGLIWIIQVVHYPSFDAIGRDGYETFQRKHMTAMGAVVGPPWLVEGLAVLAVFFFAPTYSALVLATIGGVLEAVIIGVTVMRSMPAHAQLAEGYNDAAHHQLVRTNWYRTAAWTARGAIAVALLATAL